MAESFVRIITLDSKNSLSRNLSGERNTMIDPLDTTTQSCMRDRILFQTSKGYLGLGSRWMKNGDRVVIFDGVKAPFILSPY